MDRDDAASEHHVAHVAQAAVVHLLRESGRRRKPLHRLGQIGVGVLLAGDLTTHGLPAQAEVLADACRPLEIPVVAVLGNHDYHSGFADEITDVLTAAGVTVLDRRHVILEIGDVEIVATGLMLVFMVAQGFYLNRHLKPVAEPIDTSSGRLGSAAPPASDK